jgi:hypothetical protein
MAALSWPVVTAGCSQEQWMSTTEAAKYATAVKPDVAPPSHVNHG